MSHARATWRPPLADLYLPRGLADGERLPASVADRAALKTASDHLLALAAESGARMLRVWGGGLIETEEYYSACDRAGLLVWQELSQSSSGVASAPAEDPAYVAAVATDVAALVPRLAHHPSLAVWGGGNELDRDGVPLTEAGSPVLAAAGEAVRRLDPDRHWLPTSPTGPAFFFRGGADGPEHEVHGPWEHQGLAHHHVRADAGVALAHGEFGVEGMTNRRAHEAVLPDPVTRWPADRSNPLYRHLGDGWTNADLVPAAYRGGVDRLAESGGGFAGIDRDELVRAVAQPLDRALQQHRRYVEARRRAELRARG